MRNSRLGSRRNVLGLSLNTSKKDPDNVPVLSGVNELVEPLLNQHQHQVNCDCKPEDVGADSPEQRGCRLEHVFGMEEPVDATDIYKTEAPRPYFWKKKKTAVMATAEDKAEPNTAVN